METPRAHAGRPRTEGPRERSAGADRALPARERDPAGPQPPPFRAFLPHPSAPASTTGIDSSRPVEVVTIASSRDGTHLAALSVESCRGDDIDMNVLVDRGHVRIRIEVPDAAAAAWVAERVTRIRDAVERAGLEVRDLELRQRRRGSGGRDQRRGRK